MIETILSAHLIRYPGMQIQDVYKLLHQAALGSEHAVSDPDSARSWLEQELVKMGDGPPEPVIDPISPDGKIARVHLRSFIAAGHDPDFLLDAFIRTANEYHAEIGFLEQFWQVAVNISGFPAMQMEKFMREMKTGNYPAVHHSSEYQRSYCPAYRVVALAFCPDRWL